MSNSKANRRTFIKQISLGLAGATALAEFFPAKRAFAQSLAEISESANHTLANMRTAYSLAPHITYFNHGSIGTIPKIVQQAHKGYLDLCETNPHLYMWGEPWQTAREQTREKAAKYLGCEVDELAFTHNTTEGFNLLASGLPLGAGDEVLFSSMNHSGASVCWRHYAESKNFTVKQFDFPIRDVPNLSASDIVEIYSRQITPKTKVLVFPHIDNLVGIRYPVRAMADMARSKGVKYVAVDGAQAIGMIPVNMHELGIDFYAGSPHKWVQSPKGTGLLFVRKAVQEDLRPMWVTWGQQSWQDSARKFEDYGTRNLAAVLTLGDAVDFQQKMDSQGKEARLKELWQYFIAKADAAKNINWRSPKNWELACSLYAIEVQGKDSREILDKLYKVHGVVFRAFHSENWDTLRISPNFYNTEAEMDRFFELVG